MECTRFTGQSALEREAKFFQLKALNRRYLQRGTSIGRVLCGRRGRCDVRAAEGSVMRSLKRGQGLESVQKVQRLGCRVCSAEAEAEAGAGAGAGGRYGAGEARRG